MNKKILRNLCAAAVATLVALLPACSSQGPRTVEDPLTGFSNTSTIGITKVELTDSNTVLHVNAQFRPHYWIKIAKDSYLSADGKKYAMLSAEGIEPDKEFWMPDSGNADFKLTFEPLPFSTEKFDFIEGDGEGAFRLGDIYLSGEEPTEYPEGLPKEFRKKTEDGEVPAPELAIGKTTVGFHILPFRADFFNELNMYVNSLDGRQEEYVLKFDDKGESTISFDQYGTSQAFVVDPQTGRLFASMTLAPGEDVECYIDGRISGSVSMRKSDNKSGSSYSKALHNGKYSNLDRMRDKIKDYHGLELYTGKFGDYHMTGAEYKEMVKSLYLANSDSIKAADTPDMEKEYETLKLQNDVLEAMAGYRQFLQRNYWNVNNNWGTPAPDDSIRARLDDKDFAEVTTWFDIANPKLLIAGTSIGNTDWNAYGAKGDLSRSVRLFAEMADKAKNGKLQPSDIDSLRKLSNPFFAEACDSINKRAIREYERLSQDAKVEATPEVADDKVFDAIIAPHKGKVVVVDLWNTWCGPCRAALKENEPLKSGELADYDIVWIYIADESSDAVKYLTMIPGIKGLHYKVTEQQIKAIRDRFDVDGIPYYILVDRQGKAEGRPDLRDHSKYAEAIKSKL